MTAKLSLTLLFVLFLIGTAGAQEDSGVMAFARLTEAARQAKASAPESPELVSVFYSYLTAVSDTAGKLSDLYLTTLKRRQTRDILPRIYLVSLDADTSALQSLPKLKPVESRVSSGHGCPR